MASKTRPRRDPPRDPRDPRDPHTSCKQQADALSRALDDQYQELKEAHDAAVLHREIVQDGQQDVINKIILLARRSATLLPANPNTLGRQEWDRELTKLAIPVKAALQRLTEAQVNVLTNEQLMTRWIKVGAQFAGASKSFEDCLSQLPAGPNNPASGTGGTKACQESLDRCREQEAGLSNELETLLNRSLDNDSRQKQQIATLTGKVEDQKLALEEALDELKRANGQLEALVGGSKVSDAQKKKHIVELTRTVEEQKADIDDFKRHEKLLNDQNQALRVRLSELAESTEEQVREGADQRWADLGREIVGIVTRELKQAATGLRASDPTRLPEVVEAALGRVRTAVDARQAAEEQRSFLQELLIKQITDRVDVNQHDLATLLPAIRAVLEETSEQITSRCGNAALAASSAEEV